jgi:hypothetical protein
MMKVEIEHVLGSDAIANDIRNTVKYAKNSRGTSVRLIYVPHEILIKACEKVAKGMGYMPFIPTIFGIPCQFSPYNEVRVACVADDDTNFEQQLNKQDEVKH